MAEKKQNKYFPRLIVGAFIVNEKDELLLIKQTKWKGKYSCPGGHVDGGEALQDALKREVKEEVGMNIFSIEFLQVDEDLRLGKSYLADDKHHVYLDFLAKTKDSDKIKLNKEASAYKWLKVEEWLERKDLAKGIKEILTKIKEGKCEDRYRRALADYQNLLKQCAKEKSDFAKYANEKLLREIIPVFDNLKISLEHIGTNTDDSWVTGIKYIVKQFRLFLRDAGVEEIKTKGEKFDHLTMEVVKGSGTKVSKEIRSGYKLNTKVIVAAKVELE